MPPRSAGDGLIFVRGLSRDDIGRLCERHGAAIAIVNPGDAFVIGGGREALKRDCRRGEGDARRKDRRIAG